MDGQHHPSSMKEKKETGPIQKQLHQTNPRSKEVFSSAGSVSPASSGSAFENFLFLPGFDLRTIAPFQVATHIFSPKRRCFWMNPVLIYMKIWYLHPWNPFEGKHRKQAKRKQWRVSIFRTGDSYMQSLYVLITFEEAFNHLTRDNLCAKLSIRRCLQLLLFGCFTLI